MSIRGQSNDAWIARWRGGTCPVHGVGFLEERPDSAPTGTSSDARWQDGASSSSAKAVKCPREECTVRATQWPGKDAQHSKHGWVDGPAEIRALLVKSGQIDDDGKPGRWAADARTSWPLEPE
jgi:hypothetical protein